MANKKISELTTNSSPSTSATLVGVDNGETVQIPVGALVGDTIEVKEIAFPDSTGTHNASLLRSEDDGRLELTGSEGVLIAEGHGGTILLDAEATYIEGNGEVNIKTNSRGSQILLKDGEDVEMDIRSDVVTITGNHHVELYGLNIIETVNEGSGQPGQVLMRGDDGVCWGNPSGGTGASSSIIDVVELPTEDINEDAFYRLLTGTFVFNQFVQNNFTCYCVETLPEIGEPATTDMTTITAYYNVEDGICYGYVDSALSSALSVPVGWYDMSVLLPAAGYAYVGVVTSLEDASVSDAFYLLLEYVVYSYKDGWTALKPIGKSGTVPSAEVFNHPSNIASGDCSHAEGYYTEASGDYSHAEGCGTTASGEASHTEGSATKASGGCSHAEGFNTTASGDYSHAEGCGTTASGDCSHAEGYYTEASGDYSHAEGRGTTASGEASHTEGSATKASGGCSHAEGYYTEASGDYSHAEGFGTTANGCSQHVQGEYNIVDTTTTEPNSRGKYAHIVGNGTSDTERSNAHTLDWGGNAWYAGDIYTGGAGQDDENAKKMATEEYVDEKVRSMSGGSSSGGASIIYATEKPSTPQQAIYVITEDEVVKVDVYYAQTLMQLTEAYCEIVDELPDPPKNCLTLNAEMTGVEYQYFYYLTKDNKVWTYVDEVMSEMYGGVLPVGWAEATSLGAGVSTSVDELPIDNTGFLLTKQPKTRVYVPMQDGTFLELTSGVRTRFDKYSGNVSITET